MIVFLDSGVLGKITSPARNGEVKECKVWFETLLARGVYFVTSDICGDEVRRSLVLETLKGKEAKGIRLLEDLRGVDFLPVDKNVSFRASQIWAESQFLGKPLTDPKKLDIDAIVCAHWQILNEENPGRYVIIATTNLRHLNRFAEAEEWQNIRL